MYSKGFIQLLTGMTAGQPGWVASSVNLGATTMQTHQALFNTLFALTQVAIGFGLLYRADGQARARSSRSPGRWSCGGSARRSGCCS